MKHANQLLAIGNMHETFNESHFENRHENQQIDGLHLENIKQKETNQWFTFGERTKNTTKINGLRLGNIDNNNKTMVHIW